MASFDDVDIQTMLQLEGDLTDKTLDGFNAFIRDRYGLANVAYLCPSFPGHSIVDPFASTTYDGAWTEHYRSQKFGSIRSHRHLRRALPFAGGLGAAAAGR